MEQTGVAVSAGLSTAVSVLAFLMLVYFPRDVLKEPERSIDLRRVFANSSRARLRRSHVRTFLNREFDGALGARMSCQYRFNASSPFSISHRLALSPPPDNLGISRSHALILMSAVSRKCTVSSGHPMHAGNTTR